MAFYWIPQILPHGLSPPGEKPVFREKLAEKRGRARNLTANNRVCRVVPRCSTRFLLVPMPNGGNPLCFGTKRTEKEPGASAGVPQNWFQAVSACARLWNDEIAVIRRGLS
jgi:hypothetical protein